MQWYRVIKTIKGRRYIYEQKTWREGGKVKTQSRYIGPAGDAAAEPAFDLGRLQGTGWLWGKEELRDAGFTGVGATYGMADIALVDGKPAVASSWFEGALAGLEVHADFRRQGIASALIRAWAKDGTLAVYDPNAAMLRLLQSLGRVSAPDGRGVVTLVLGRGAAVAPVDKAAETALIKRLFDGKVPEQEWDVPWSEALGEAGSRFAIDTRVFAVAARMGLKGTTRASWPRFAAPRFWTGDMEDGAWYVPRQGRLQVPAAERFETREAFERVFFHELGHATKPALERKPRWRGASGALDPQATAFQNYAEEELVAELAASLVMARLRRGSDGTELSAAYLQHWLGICEQPDKARRWAIKEARKAADYLVAQWQAVNTTN